MRILILSQHFPPEPITRLRDLTQYLVAQGHEVSVLTTYPSYPFGKVYDGYKLGVKSRHKELGADVERVFAMPYRGSAKSKRILSYSSFAVCALLFGLFTRKRPDVVYAYHPPLTTGWAAGIYNRLTGVPFVYDVQDLWPEAIMAAGMLHSGSRLYRMIRRLENWVYSRAKHVTVISSGQRENLIGKGVPPEKLSIISNWGDPAVYHPMDASEVRAKRGWGERFVVLLAGNLGLTHGLETVIEAADLLKDRKDILIAFLGAGSAREQLQNEAKRRNLENVVFYDQVPSAEAAQNINAADLMLIHLKADLGGEFSVPHRIFSYFLCGKAVVAAAKGSTADLVRSLDGGWTCEPSDPVALSQTIAEAAKDRAEVEWRGKNTLAVSQDAYNREYLLKQIESVLEQASR